MLAGAKTKGEKIRIEGRVFDGIGTVLKDVLIEIWQANAPAVRAPRRPATGQGDRPGVSRLGARLHRLRDRRLHLRHRQAGPGRRPQRPDHGAAHHAWIVARGINIGLNTRIYFSDEADANANDAVLNLIEWEQRRATLVAERLDRKLDGGAAVYRFDIRLQGENETVFFDV